jgi:glycosyltransferase involved in cell wall biosynthesis
MASSTPRVSIVIRAFNEEKHIGNLLQAIKDQSLQDYEIILVDSGSTDQTLAIASRFPVSVLHIKPAEFTFGRSLNMGLAAAQGEIAVLASAHVVPSDKHWLERLVAPFADPKTAIAYGKQRGGTGSKFSEARHFIRWFPDISDFNQPHAYCNNANLALRLRLWREQPFDETLTGLEDLAWSSALREQGYKIAYVTEAGVTHLHDESSTQIVNRHRREAIALKRILPKSRFTLWHFASLYVRSAVSDFGTAIRQHVFLREALGIISFRFLQYLGTYRGYHDPVDPSLALKRVFYYPPGALEKRTSPEVANSIQDTSRRSAKV